LEKIEKRKSPRTENRGCQYLSQGDKEEPTKEMEQQSEM